MPGVFRATIMKAGQMACSTAVHSYIGWRIEQDPCPIAYVMPSRPKLNQVFRDDLIPMVADTPPLSDLTTGRRDDVTKERISFAHGVTLQGVWAGSAFESHPYGVVGLDEVDRYPRFTGKGNDTLAQAEVRARSYGARARLIENSTPATQLDPTAQSFDSADYVFYFHVRCRHCGTRITLDWPFIKYAPAEPGEDKHAHAARVRGQRLCWYECQACGEHLDDDQRRAAVRQGGWRTLADGDRPAIDLAAVDRFPTRTHLAFQIGTQYCLWPGFHLADLAAKWIRSQGDRDALLDFRTLWLGLPFEEQIHKIAPNVFFEKCQRAALPEGVIPQWAYTLLASIDTQDPGFYVEIRAFGAWPRSQRVWHGFVDSFDDIDRLCTSTYFKVESDAVPPQRVSRACIDTGGTGSRTMEVYEFVRKRTRWLVPIKGAPGPKGSTHAWPGKGWFDVGASTKKSRKGRHIQIWRLDVHHFHDLLADLIVAGTGTDESPEVWLLNKRDDAVYNTQMANLHKTVILSGSRQQLKWLPVTPGARHDYRDLNAYMIFLAYHLGIDQQTEEGVNRWQEAQRSRARAQSRGEAPGEKKKKRGPDPWQPKDYGHLIR